MKRLVVGILMSSAMTLPAFAALKQGDKAPDFSAKASLAGKEFDFSLKAALKKGPVVVYFYPSAFTGGCNIEAHTFAVNKEKFDALGATIIGVSRSKLSAQAFADKLKGPLQQHSRQKVESAAWEKFAGMLDYVGGEFHDDAVYIELKARLEAAKTKGTRGNRVFYLSTPPTAFPVILQKLQQHGLIERQVQVLRRFGKERRLVIRRPDFVGALGAVQTPTLRAGVRRDETAVKRP